MNSDYANRANEATEDTSLAKEHLHEMRGKRLDYRYKDQWLSLSYYQG